MIQVKVSIGGGGTPPSQASTTTFVNATGVAVTSYTDADLVYVKVVDPSHAGATTLEQADDRRQTFALAPLAGRRRQRSSRRDSALTLRRATR